MRFKDSISFAPPGKIFTTGSGILKPLIKSFTFLIACNDWSTVRPSLAEVPLLPEGLAYTNSRSQE
jgi:hypothetical protein